MHYSVKDNLWILFLYNLIAAYGIEFLEIIYMVPVRS